VSSSTFWSISMIALLLAAMPACNQQEEPRIVAGVDGCDECGMVIDQVREACIYEVDKNFRTFCSPGCLLKSFDRRRKEGESAPDRILFSDYEEGGLAPAEAVTFLLSNHRPTTMGWGILAFSDPERAVSHVQHEDEALVDWVGLRTLRGEPDQRIVWVLGPGGFDPFALQIEKGELVELVLEGRGLDEDRKVMLRGYEECGEVVVPAAGPAVEVRLLATRPGEGFPFVTVPGGEVLGQLRVVGPHTPDEEEM